MSTGWELWLLQRTSITSTFKYFSFFSENSFNVFRFCCFSLFRILACRRVVEYECALTKCCNLIAWHRNRKYRSLILFWIKLATIDFVLNIIFTVTIISVMWAQVAKCDPAYLYCCLIDFFQPSMQMKMRFYFQFDVIRFTLRFSCLFGLLISSYIGSFSTISKLVLNFFCDTAVVYVQNELWTHVVMTSLFFLCHSHFHCILSIYNTICLSLELIVRLSPKIAWLLFVVFVWCKVRLWNASTSVKS